MTTEEQEQEEQSTISIERELKKSYLDYAMSVIVGRALPDVRDGLHTTADAWALVKVSPRAASLSILGVRTWEWPSRTLTQSFRSSIVMNRTSGLSASCAARWTEISQKTATASSSRTLKP